MADRKPVAPFALIEFLALSPDDAVASEAVIDCVHSAGQSFRLASRSHIDIRQAREQVRLQIACRDQVRKRDPDFSDPDATALSERLSPELIQEIKERLLSCAR